MKQLGLNNNKIKDFSSLNNLPNLTDLHLWKTDIKDVSFLNELKHLDFVNLSDNQIEDISSLLNHPSLKSIIINGNPLNANAKADLKYLADEGIMVF